MHAGLSEFLAEQSKGLAELAAGLRKSRAAAARRAAKESAARIEALNGRVRALARAGVRVTAASHGAVQDLIELQAEIVGSALTEASEQIQRLGYTESVRDLARVQADVLQAARHRIVEDMSRAVTILKRAAGEARGDAVRAGGARSVKGKRTARRSARRPVRGKAKVKAQAKAKARAKVVTAAKRTRSPARKTVRRG